MRDTVDWARPTARVRSTIRRSPRASSCTITSRVTSPRLRNNATAADKSAEHEGSCSSDIIAMARCYKPRARASAGRQASAQRPPSPPPSRVSGLSIPLGV